ncbi:uncharacterized protein isoform X2 [Leptinotarsa decemlineata]|uniref:uncharacterized protein isoform X2 n=1 Tax=Leptinotarsa decemlineata TaxID=7539 RepID=UPI003D30A86D
MFYESFFFSTGTNLLCLHYHKKSETIFHLCMCVYCERVKNPNIFQSPMHTPISSKFKYPLYKHTTTHTNSKEIFLEPIEKVFLINCPRKSTKTEPTQPPIYPSIHPRSMLYKPIYVKGRRVMHETLIPMGRPIPSPPPEPQAPNLPEPPVEEEDEVATEDGDEGLKRLPMLISRYKLVVPRKPPGTYLPAGCRTF